MNTIHIVILFFGGLGKILGWKKIQQVLKTVFQC